MEKFFLSLAEASWGRTLIAGFFAFGLYYMLAYNDGSALNSMINQANQELNEAETQLKATKDAVANADRFEREVKSIVDQFTHVVDFMPRKVSSAELTTIISELSNRSGAKLLKTEPRSNKDAATFYDTTRLAFTLEGSFSQIVMFLSQLSRVPKLMTFERTELFADDNADLEAPKLTFNAVLVGYSYIGTKTPEKTANAETGAQNATH